MQLLRGEEWEQGQKVVLGLGMEVVVGNVVGLIGQKEEI
jgi:hypothetical protein